MSYAKLTHDQMAARVARDIPEGSCVNLGIGLPTLVANHVTKAGATISTQISKIVVVKTGAFAPSPGRGGAGSVVATVCG